MPSPPRQGLEGEMYTGLRMDDSSAQPQEFKPQLDGGTAAAPAQPPAKPAGGGVSTVRQRPSDSAEARSAAIPVAPRGAEYVADSPMAREQTQQMSPSQSGGVLSPHPSTGLPLQNITSIGRPAGAVWGSPPPPHLPLGKRSSMLRVGATPPGSHLSLGIQGSDYRRSESPGMHPHGAPPQSDLVAVACGNLAGTMERTMGMERTVTPVPAPYEEDIANLPKDKLLEQLSLRDARVRELEAELVVQAERLAHAVASGVQAAEAGEGAARAAIGRDQRSDLVLIQELWDNSARLAGMGESTTRRTGTPPPTLGRRDSRSPMGVANNSHSALGPGMTTPVSPTGMPTTPFAVVSTHSSGRGPNSGPLASPAGADPRTRTWFGAAIHRNWAPLPVEFRTAKRMDRDFGTSQYDPGSSLVRRAHEHQTASRKYWHRVGIELFRWTLTLLIGMCTACVAWLIDFFVKKLYDWKFDHLMDAIKNCENCKTHPYSMYVGYNILLTACAAVLVFVAPVAAGSGIPEIKCFLNGVKIPGVLEAKTLVAKATGVLFSVAAGLPCGKEGPMIHSGAIVAAGIGQGQAKFAKCQRLTPLWGDLRNDAEKRDFVSCGAAAGVAAAFGAPIGGLLFAVEEGCSFFKPELLWRIFFCSIASAFTMSFITMGEEHEKALNAPGMINFGDFTSTRSQGVAFEAKELPVFITIGILGGLLGAGFNNANMVITRGRTKAAEALDRAFTRCIDRRRELVEERNPLLAAAQFTYEAEVEEEAAAVPGCGAKQLRAGIGVPKERGLGWRLVRVVEALFMSFLVSSAAFFCIAALPEACGHDVPLSPAAQEDMKGGGEAGQDERDAWRYVYCSDKEQHNQWATLWFNPLADTLRTLFHTESHFSPGVLAGFCGMFLLLSVVNYGVGVPSGLFVPSLVTGATYGRLIGQLLHDGTDAYGHVDIGTYSLIGAASFLAGVCRITFSLTVILIEATRDISYAVPLMITIMAAKFSGDLFSKGIYDEHIEYRKVPFLEPSIPRNLGEGTTEKHLTIRDLLVADCMSPPPRGPRVGLQLMCAHPTKGEEFSPRSQKRALRKATVTAYPAEPDHYVSLHFEGEGRREHVVTEKWFEEESHARIPCDKSKPQKLVTLPPVARAHRVLEALGHDICGFPVVADHSDDADAPEDASLTPNAAHDGLITRATLFVLLQHFGDASTPTLSAVRAVCLQPSTTAAALGILAPELIQQLEEVRSGRLTRGWVHCRDRQLLYGTGGMVCRVVYRDPQCSEDDPGAMFVPVSWIRDAPVENLDRALPFTNFINKLGAEFVRTGKHRLGFTRLRQMRSAIDQRHLDGAPMRDAYCDLRPYMNEQPYVVPDNFSFARAYTLFRAVGMRHMLVVDASHHIKGIVTRSDLYKTLHVAEALHHGHTHDLPMQNQAEQYADGEDALEQHLDSAVPGM